MQVIIIKCRIIKLLKTLCFCTSSQEINQWNVHCFAPVYSQNTGTLVVLVYILCTTRQIWHGTQMCDHVCSMFCIIKNTYSNCYCPPLCPLCTGKLAVWFLSFTDAHSHDFNPYYFGHLAFQENQVSGIAADNLDAANVCLYHPWHWLCQIYACYMNTVLKQINKQKVEIVSVYLSCVSGETCSML